MTVGWILSKFFIERAFSEEAKNFGDRIVSDIKDQFIKKLQVTEWMSKDVRQKGIEKGKKSFWTFSNACALTIADCSKCTILYRRSATPRRVQTYVTQRSYKTTTKP